MHIKQKNQQPYLKGLFDSIRASFVARGITLQPLGCECQECQSDVCTSPESCALPQQPR